MTPADQENTSSTQELNPHGSVSESTPQTHPQNKILIIFSLLLMIAIGISALLFIQNQSLKNQLSPSKICEYEGETYGVGEGFTASDGCNTCSCTENGQIACTLMACENEDQVQADPTTDWETYTIPELNLTFKLPQNLVNDDLILNTTPGENGIQHCWYLSRQQSRIIQSVHAGGGPCFSLKDTLWMGATSTDYEAGRSGGFSDYTKEVYQVVGGEIKIGEVLIRSDLGSEVTNKNGVPYARIIGESDEPMKGSEVGWPLPGTPGEGYIGALIKTNSEKFPLLALELNLEKGDELLFDQILSTFELKNSTLQTVVVSSPNGSDLVPEGTINRYQITYEKPSPTTQHEVTDELYQVLLIKDENYELFISFPTDGGVVGFYEKPAMKLIGNSQLDNLTRLTTGTKVSLGKYGHAYLSNATSSDNKFIYTNNFSSECNSWNPKPTGGCGLMSLDFQNPLSAEGKSTSSISCTPFSDTGEQFCDKIVSSLQIRQLTN
jgi:hypothetical protein